jgi:CHAD domain-containing protein
MEAGTRAGPAPAPPPLKELRLLPDERADAGLARVYLSLLASMEANRAGCLVLDDVEAVHDLRVATRRTRAGLSEIRRVLDPAVVEARKAEFRAVGDATGEARDMDVFLLKWDRLMARVVEADRPALEPVRALIRERRDLAQTPMEALLGSADYSALLAGWRHFLEQLPADAGPKHADRPLLRVARSRIKKRYRRVVRRGLAIDEHTEEEALHRLRLDCKKLRYLLEFFRSLFDAEQMTRFIATLKQLQDNLGDFNDCAVQVVVLGDLADELRSRGTDAATLAALARLIEAVRSVQRDDRAAFRSAFEPFAAEPTRLLFDSLFA